MPGPSRPSFHSSPNEPTIRRLGVKSSASIERPFRVQLILLIAGLLLLLSLPIYFFRSPSSNGSDATQESQAPMGFAPIVAIDEQASAQAKRIRLSPARRIKCSSSAAATGQTGRGCDQLPAIEKALATAIRETLDCAPRTGDPGTLNYVLKVNFEQKTLHVFPGASGQWRGPQARRATSCVKQALPPIEWNEMAHRFRYYEFAILASYQPPPPTQVPLFE